MWGRNVPLLLSVYLARLSTLPAHSYLQFSKSEHSIQHTLRRMAFPQAVIKHVVRSTGNSSEEKELFVTAKNVQDVQRLLCFGRTWLTACPPPSLARRSAQYKCQPPVPPLSVYRTRNGLTVNAAYSSALKIVAEENSPKKLVSMYQTIRCQSSYSPTSLVTMHNLYSLDTTPSITVSER
jgi:hypothetical protein